MNNKELIAHLKKQGACENSLEWLGARDSRAMWSQCPYPDWLTWYAIRNGARKDDVIKVSCQIARTVLHLVPRAKDNTYSAIETIEAWLEGKATLEQVKVASFFGADTHIVDYRVNRVAISIATVTDVAKTAGFRHQNAISCKIIRTMWPTCPGD
jgi:hypothetical protein